MWRNPTTWSTPAPTTGRRECPVWFATRSIDVLAGHHHRRHRAAAEVECTREQRVLELFEQTFIVRRVDHGRELGRGVRGADLVLRRETERPNDCARTRVEEPDHRPKECSERAADRCEHEQRSLRAGECHAFRHHLAEHHVRRDDEQQCERERNAVRDTVREDSDLVERRFDHIGHGRLAEHTETE
jgi:hypothetical protein